MNVHYEPLSVCLSVFLPVRHHNHAKCALWVYKTNQNCMTGVKGMTSSGKYVQYALVSKYSHTPQIDIIIQKEPSKSITNEFKQFGWSWAWCKTVHDNGGCCWDLCYVPITILFVSIHAICSHWSNVYTTYHRFLMTNSDLVSVELRYASTKKWSSDFYQVHLWCKTFVVKKKTDKRWPFIIILLTIIIRGIFNKKAKNAAVECAEHVTSPSIFLA